MSEDRVLRRGLGGILPITSSGHVSGLAATRDDDR